MRRRFFAKAFAFVLAVLLSCAGARAHAAAPGSELTVSVLTFGPGDHPFYKFGHNAIWIHDDRFGRDLVYNFGTFDFHSKTLVSDFLKGRLSYWLSVQSLDGTIAHYRAERRSITAQQLALNPEQRSLIAQRLMENALPQNRAYRYDYYRDNCSTRVRDVLDGVIDGRLHEASKGPAALSFRGHTTRLTADDPSLALALDAAMGDVIDQPITQWEEMFLPSKLHDGLTNVAMPGPDGDVPLVANEITLLSADRPPLRTTPPQWHVPMALAGLALGGLLAWLGRMAPKRRAARVGFGLLLLVFALPAGVLGGIFAFFWFGTDHGVAHHNENLLQCSPLALVIVVLSIGVMWGRAGAMDKTRKVLSVIAGGAVLGIVLKVLPWFDQVNGQIIALMLPAWAGAATGARWMTAGTPTSTPTPTPTSTPTSTSTSTPPEEEG